MEQEFWEEDHRLFRDSFRKFVQTEIVPYHAQWERDGVVSREVWRKAGEQGYLAMGVPEEYGGPGIDDFRFNMVVGEELTRVGASGVAFTLHNDIIVPYFVRYGTDEQKRRYLPKMVSGEIVTAIAMSEPGAGSDLASIQTTASQNGAGYILNGRKTFITNGVLNDVVVVVAKTGGEDRHKNISLLVVERGMQGYETGRKLDKIGMKAQDTAELFFKDVQVPGENLLGEEGRGFYHLMEQLPRERFSIAYKSITAAETALEFTANYCRERKAFGRPIGKFQNSRFKLAEMKTEITIGRIFVNHCAMLLNRAELTVEKAAMAKWWCSDLVKRVTDQCLQLHGGYGYMTEYPISKAYVDARVQTIFGGSNEIMKEIIGRGMGF